MIKSLAMDYKHYLQVFKILADLLLLNQKRQAIYLDISPPSSWSDALFHIWTGDDENRIFRQAKVKTDRQGIYIVRNDGDRRSRLDTEKIYFPDLFALSSREERDRFWPILCAFLGLAAKELSFDPELRFSVWGRTLRSAIYAIEKLNTPKRKWFLHSIHHGGWGTYYLVFGSRAVETIFALSEGGHFALWGNKSATRKDWTPENQRYAGNYDFRKLVKSKLPQNTLNDRLWEAIAIINELNFDHNSQEVERSAPKLKKKTKQLIDFIDSLHAHITSDPQFRSDVSRKSEQSIQAELRPLILNFLKKQFRARGLKSYESRAHESFYWEGQEGSFGKAREPVFASRNYPDFIITSPYRVAIEYKQGESGSLVKQALGQAFMHTLSEQFDYSYILFHDSSKEKKIRNSVSGANEKKIISAAQREFNVFLRFT